MTTQPADQGTERLMSELAAWLEGKPWVPHGFKVESVQTTSRPNIFASSLAINYTAVKMRVPVIWEIERGSVPVRASDTPDTKNLEELRALIENGLASGEYGELRAGTLEDWETELPDGPHPQPDAAWLVTARIRSAREEHRYRKSR